jgi:hypothetical protein
MNMPLLFLDPYVPSTEKPWNAHRVRHLYNRLGFGASLAEVEDGLTMNPGELIDQLIDGVLALPDPDPPSWADWVWDDYNGDFDLYFTHKTELRRRWIAEMINEGFRSKLALFWHNHFVAEELVYDCNNYMWSYFDLLHRRALGNFRLFVEEMGTNPAMLVYLNGNLNVAGAPNENYARELMELFTMGENNGYTQQDVVEVARALTGWQVNMYECTQPYFDFNLHDNQPKTIFGQTGNWNFGMVHELIFTERQDEVANYICSKIYRAFVSEELDPEVIQSLADTFKQNDWELAPVFRQLFKSDHFFSERVINARVKDPVSTFVSLLRSAGLNYPDQIELDWLGDIDYLSMELGQDLFNPIDVAGWPGQRAWLNETTLTLRWGFSGSLLYFRMVNNDNTRIALQELAININPPNEKDPEVVTANLIDHFLNTSLTDNNFQTAVQYFKAEVPENYFEDGTWSLYYDEVPDQMISLLYYLTRLPEWQLS